MSPLSIALVHHPVLDAKDAVTTSTLTTLDVHDLARSARTYGCESFFIVHPVEAQRTLAARIVDHWTHGSSAKRIPDRKDALAIVRTVATLEEAVRASGEGTRLWVTAARARSVFGPSDRRPAPGGTSGSGDAPLSWAVARDRLAGGTSPVLLVFGTSWGLAPSVIADADALLEPIRGHGDWNHLSVRAACAIPLDRLRS